MAEYKRILVCGELSKGELAAITRELLTIGRKLTDDLGEVLAALLMGEGLQNFGQKAISSGADKMYLADHSLLA